MQASKASSISIARCDTTFHPVRDKLAYTIGVEANRPSYEPKKCSRVSGFARPDVIASALFVCPVRCSGSEFLEGRIVPQRIEHRIEPEQRGSERRKLSEKFSVYCFGAREATIFSKRGSPRSGSQKGCSFSAP